MDQLLVQRSRYLLQVRFNRILKATHGNFANVVSQNLNWLENHPIISSVLSHLDGFRGTYYDELELLRTHKPDRSRYLYIVRNRIEPDETEPDYKGYTPKTIEEDAANCLHIMRIAAVEDIGFLRTLAVYLQRERDIDNYPDAVRIINQIAVTNVYEYIDETLDGLNAINGLLRKYKQSCEWFQQAELRKITDDGYGGKTGERAFAVHLQEFIFDQSIEFTIEPSSTSGEADFVLRDPNGQITIIDAKFINQGATTYDVKRKIAAGFNQVQRYCNDYNQLLGFLAVFVNDDITILIDVEQDGPFRYFKIGGYTVYYVEINIAERPSASKAGKAKQIRITADQLTEQLQEIAEETDAGQ